MATILVRGVSESTLRRLKKLKVEMDCDTWAELLDRLLQQRQIIFTREDVSEMRQGATEFVALANKVSKKWHGPPSVLEEFRASRKHGRE